MDNKYSSTLKFRMLKREAATDLRKR